MTRKRTPLTANLLNVPPDFIVWKASRLLEVNHPQTQWAFDWQYISTKPNIKAVFPLKEAGIDHAGVIKLLEDSGIGMPPYLKWGRTHSGCYFCFFQRPIEWVRLLETHPEQFEEAMKYEKISDDPGKTFTWAQGMSLSELRKPENIAAIKRRHEEYEERRKLNRGNKKLVEVLAGMEEDDDGPKACLICQL
jgi:hypothetical protein